MRLAPILQFTLLLGIVDARPQGILSEIASAFGFGDDPTTTSQGKTLAPPAVATSTPAKATKTSNAATSTVTSNSSHTATSTGSSSQSKSTGSQTNTITSASSSSETSSSATSTSTSSSSSSSASTSISTPPAPPAVASPTASSTPTPSSGVPPGGVAVAVIMTLAVIGIIAYLIFRYHPGIRARWLARQEQKMQERSYRDAIDGPFAKGGSGVRNQTSRNHSRKSMLQSFFAPRTVRLGNGQEIRRKPVNWGVTTDSSPNAAELPDNSTGMGMEKVALTNMAAPMARTESVMSGVSYISGGGSHIGGSSGTISSRSSPALPQKELPPMPPMPPVPPVPTQSQQRGGEMHRILSRKSIFELA